MIESPASALPPAAIERATGAGVRVLVMDSGIDVAHPAFAGREIESFQVIARQVADATTWQVGEAPAGDAFGHGTAVASILVEHAPGVRIDSLRVLDPDRFGSSERVLAGLRWAIQRRYDVVNCSFGTYGPTATRFLASYKRVVDLAFCENVLLIGACSNSDHRLTSLPASFPTVISADGGRVEPASPPRLLRRPGQLIEFVARGVDVAVPWREGTNRTVTGSSFAAPHLAAVVARLRELRPQWNACEMKAALYALAQPIEPADETDPLARETPAEEGLVR